MREVMDRLLDRHVEAPGAGRRRVRSLPDPDRLPAVGAPEEDWKLFSAGRRPAADLQLQLHRGPADHRRRPERGRPYVREMIERRRTEPADDLLTDLIAAEESGDRLSTEELESMAIAVLIAGPTRPATSSAARWRCSGAPRPVALLVERPSRRCGRWRSRATSAPSAGPPGSPARTSSTGASCSPGHGRVDQLHRRQPRRARLHRPDHARHHASRRRPTSPSAAASISASGAAGAAELQEALPILARRLPDLALDGLGGVEAEHGRHLGPGFLPLTFTAN